MRSALSASYAGLRPAGAVVSICFDECILALSTALNAF